MTDSEILAGNDQQIGLTKKIGIRPHGKKDCEQVTKEL